MERERDTTHDGPTRDEARDWYRDDDMRGTVPSDQRTGNKPESRPDSKPEPRGDPRDDVGKDTTH